MNIQHFERGISYSERELLVVARKLGKLATYCKRLKDEESSIRLEAERRPTKKNRDQVMAALTVDLPGKTLRAESRRNRVIEAVDRAMEKLEPQLKKYKELRPEKTLARAVTRKQKVKEKMLVRGEPTELSMAA